MPGTPRGMTLGVLGMMQRTTCWVPQPTKPLPVFRTPGTPPVLPFPILGFFAGFCVAPRASLAACGKLGTAASARLARNGPCLGPRTGMQMTPSTPSTLPSPHLESDRLPGGAQRGRNLARLELALREKHRQEEGPHQLDRGSVAPTGGRRQRGRGVCGRGAARGGPNQQEKSTE